MRFSRNILRLLLLALCLALCAGLCLTASAAGEGITVTLDKSELSVSSEEQTVTMTVAVAAPATISGYEFTSVYPDGFAVSDIASDDAGVGGTLSAAYYNMENGKVIWYASNLSDREISLFGRVTFTIPANTPAGTYTLGVKNVRTVSDGGATYVLRLDAPVSVGLVITAAGSSADAGGNGGSAGAGTEKPDMTVTPPDTGTRTFSDVAADAWYAEAVSFVSQNGIMTGTSDTAFSPDGKVTRGMMVTILWKLEGQPQASGGDGFDDVSDDAWYSEAINWAAELKIVNGYGGGKFGPLDNITRQQMALVLYSYAKYKGYDLDDEAELDGFPDGKDVSAWAEASVRWAAANALLNGLDDGTLAPGGSATRAQAATILMRFCRTLAAN